MYFLKLFERLSPFFELVKKMGFEVGFEDGFRKWATAQKTLCTVFFLTV
jgi:hypothetical protein